MEEKRPWKIANESTTRTNYINHYTENGILNYPIYNS